MDPDSMGRILVSDSADGNEMEVDPKDTAELAAEAASRAASSQLNSPVLDRMPLPTRELLDTYLRLDKVQKPTEPEKSFTLDDAIVCLGYAMRQLDEKVTAIVDKVPRSTPETDRLPLFGEWDRLRAQLTEDILGSLESL